MIENPSALSNYFEYENISAKLESSTVDIADRNTAVEMMAKLDTFQARVADLQEYKKSKVKVLDDRIRELNKDIDAIRDGLEQYILEYNNGETINYPDVGVAYVTTKTDLDIEDETELINHLKKVGMNDYIRVRESVDKREVKSYAQDRLKNTGRLIPGVVQTEKTTFVYRSPR